MQYGMTFITGAWRFINKIDEGYKKGPVPYIKYSISYIWDLTLYFYYFLIFRNVGEQEKINFVHANWQLREASEPFFRELYFFP